MGLHLTFIVPILALAASLAYASDPSPLQDFCVAVNDSKAAVCKNPEQATANDFWFSGLLTARNASNPFGTAVTLVDVDRIPGPNTFGISVAPLDFARNGVNPPHTHPRASEILVVLEGTLYAGFVTSNPEHRLITKVLQKGDAFVFPVGLIHFQLNIGKTNAVALVSFNSQNPGVITVASAIFGSSPPIFDNVLTKAFQLDKKVVDTLQAKVWYNTLV